ncbi:MAG TPA: general secretion pathway protein GspB [Methylomirabilota bacterium]
MSYILDALKKAAEQRSGPPPEVRRLLSAAPVAAISASRYVMLGIASVSVIALLAVIWMWAHEVPAPTAPTAKSVASLVAVPTASEPTQTPRPRVTAGDAPRVPLTAIESARDAARSTAASKRATAAKAPVIEKTLPRTPAPAAMSPAPAVVSPAPAPPIMAALPPTPAPATARSDTGKLKVEVIVYSEQRPLRWVFINGRKYVEGDTIEGARIEEILSNAVVLVEDGRRVTLRP